MRFVWSAVGAGAGGGALSRAVAPVECDIANVAAAAVSRLRFVAQGLVVPHVIWQERSTHLTL